MFIMDVWSRRLQIMVKYWWLLISFTFFHLDNAPITVSSTVASLTGHFDAFDDFSLFSLDKYTFHSIKFQRRMTLTFPIIYSRTGDVTANLNDIDRVFSPIFERHPKGTNAVMYSYATWNGLIFMHPLFCALYFDTKSPNLTKIYKNSNNFIKLWLNCK